MIWPTPARRASGPRTAVWIVPVADLGGVARHVIDSCEVGIPGWAVTVACPPGPLADVLQGMGRSVMPVDIGPGVPVRAAVTTVTSVLEMLRPAVVHTHLPRADFLAALARPELVAARVSTEHTVTSVPGVYHRSRRTAAGRRVAHHLRTRRFAALIAVSEATRRAMLQQWHPRVPVTVVRNGIDRPACAVSREPGMRFLSLGRLSPEKNTPATLRAFARIAAEHPGARLTVAGIGEEEGTLRRLAADLGIADIVRFPGFLDPVSAMHDHDVLLQPAHAENLSYSVLDAVASGLGCVASTVGGNPEILPPSALVMPDDDAALARLAVMQGLDVSRRPRLPASIPTRMGMTAQIADVYAMVAS